MTTQRDGDGAGGGAGGGFDPRYERAFQRGFTTPATPETTSSTASGGVRPADAPRGAAPPTEDASPARVDGPVIRDVPAALAGGDAEQREPVAGARGARPAPDEDDDLDPEARASAAEWRNPFVIGLLVAGAVIAAVGVAWSVQLREMFDGQGGLDQQVDYWNLQVGTFGAPMVICFGVATMLSAVVVLAIRWRR